MSLIWQLISCVKVGERVVSLYSAPVPGATLYKDVTTYTDRITGLVKVVSESMAVVPS